MTSDRDKRPDPNGLLEDEYGECLSVEQWEVRERLREREENKPNGN